MKTPAFVKPLPFPFNFIFKGCTFGNLVFIRKSLIKNLKNSNPNSECIGVLIHELTHRKRMREIGISKHAWKYLTSPKFRFNEEIMANISQMKFLKNQGVMFDINKRAKHLSGFRYLWCTSYKDANSKLKEIWNSF